MDKRAPIGIFDSGVGGLSVFKPIADLLPKESLIYLADSAHAPYGTKTIAEILGFAEACTDFLITAGVKLIVVACNTATGVAIRQLREKYPQLAFVGMEPAIKPAAAASHSGTIGVLATAQTFEADHFQQTKNKFAEQVEVELAIGTGLVELVENGQALSQEAEVLLANYLLPMVEKGMDQLVLGCTHYPFLVPVIKRILPDFIAIHDPAPAVARQVLRILTDSDMLNDTDKGPDYRFETTGDPTVLNGLVVELLRQY